MKKKKKRLFIEMIMICFVLLIILLFIYQNDHFLMKDKSKIDNPQASLQSNDKKNPKSIRDKQAETLSKNKGKGNIKEDDNTDINSSFIYEDDRKDVTVNNQDEEALYSQNQIQHTEEPDTEKLYTEKKENINQNTNEVLADNQNQNNHTLTENVSPGEFEETPKNKKHTSNENTPQLELQDSGPVTLPDVPLE